MDGNNSEGPQQSTEAQIERLREEIGQLSVGKDVLEEVLHHTDSIARYSPTREDNETP